MKLVKAKTVNAFTYREGFGRLTVVDTTPDAPRPKHKPLYYATRQFGTGEELDVIMDNGYALYKEPEPIVKKKTRKKRR